MFSGFGKDQSKCNIGMPQLQQSNYVILYLYYILII